MHASWRVWRNSRTYQSMSKQGCPSSTRLLFYHAVTHCRGSRHRGQSFEPYGSAYDGLPIAALVEISFTAHWMYQRYCDRQLRSWIVTRSLHQGLPLVDGFQCSCYDTAKCEYDDLHSDRAVSASDASRCDLVWNGIKCGSIQRSGVRRTPSWQRR